ncbi:extracellular solute-binding protein [Paenibacillus sp.]|uniref:extracellular solute-binding protein n=1 Tax=Paenibacillus sp. TaxID=58172 RepID=UPI002810A296|nr:extracellular solute-binding protein [Paenibacillus sp.]
MENKPSRTTFRERMDEMIRTLRSDIVTGKLQSGTFLPSIHQLSKQYRLSINSVQKGLDELVAESLIERIPRVGIRVTDTREHKAVSISVGYYPTLVDDIDLNRLTERFQLRYPHIRVKLVPLQLSNYFDVADYYLKNEIVDVIAINQIHFRQFFEADGDLEDRFEPLEEDDGHYPYLSDPYRANGRLLVKPVIFSPVVLCYNKRHFAERGVPEPPMDWKWSEFMECLELLKGEHGDVILPFYFYPSTSNRWPIFILQSGVDFAAQRSGKLDWSCSPILDSIQTCYDLIHRQKMFSILLSENDFGVERLFAQQKVSVMMTSYFNLNRMRNADLAFDVAPLPYVHTPKTLLLTIGLALNRRSKQKEAGRTFIDFVTSAESQLHIRKHTYSIPALRQAAEWEGEEARYRPPRFGMYRDISHTYAQLYDLELRSDDRERLLAAMNMYWMGLQSIETTISQLSAIGDYAPAK